jgi:hypothetical protein
VSNYTQFQIPLCVPSLPLGPSSALFPYALPTHFCFTGQQANFS